MNRTTKSNLLAAIEAAEQHTVEDLLLQLETEFLEKANQIAHLLNSEEGTNIYWSSLGASFERQRMKRLILEKKMYTLYDVCEKLCRKRLPYAIQDLCKVLACKYCKRWHKDKDSSDVADDAAWGECDIIECGSYGSDFICTDFEAKEYSD